MEPDVCLIAGLLLGGLSIPAVLSAISDSRSPRGGSVGLLVSVALIAYAATVKPGGYQLEEIPDVFFAVLGDIL